MQPAKRNTHPSLVVLQNHACQLSKHSRSVPVRYVTLDEPSFHKQPTLSLSLSLLLFPLGLFRDILCFLLPLENVAKGKKKNKTNLNYFTNPVGKWTLDPFVPLKYTTRT